MLLSSEMAVPVIMGISRNLLDITLDSKCGLENWQVFPFVLSKIVNLKTSESGPVSNT